MKYLKMLDLKMKDQMSGHEMQDLKMRDHRNMTGNWRTSDYTMHLVGNYEIIMF